MELDFIRPAPFFFQDAAYLTVTIVQLHSFSRRGVFDGYGETAYVTYQGGTTRERFVDYLKDTLIPTLHDGDVIIMDNMRSHHVKEVAEVIGQSDKHLSLLYMPPYSPDFNPIEMMWSKIKAILRMLKARVPEMLSKAVEIAGLSQIMCKPKIMVQKKRIKYMMQLAIHSPAVLAI